MSGGRRRGERGGGVEGGGRGAASQGRIRCYKHHVSLLLLQLHWHPRHRKQYPTTPEITNLILNRHPGLGGGGVCVWGGGGGRGL